MSSAGWDRFPYFIGEALSCTPSVGCASVLQGLPSCEESDALVEEQHRGASFLLHPTQHWLFLPTLKALLSGWVMLGASLSRADLQTDQRLGRLSEGAEAVLLSLRLAAARGETPHPQLLAAAQAIVEVIRYLTSKGDRWQDALNWQQRAPNADPTGQREETQRRAAPKDPVAVSCPMSREGPKATPYCAAAAARRLAAACLFLLPDIPTVAGAHFPSVCSPVREQAYVRVCD